MSSWQRLDTKIVYQNPYLTLHEDNAISPNGRHTVYPWVETFPGVMIIAVDHAGKVMLVKQARYITGQPSWELPGGGVEGEDPLAAAKRELAEECGLHADKWVSLTTEFYVCNGITPDRESVHIARELHKVAERPEGADDVIDEVKAFSWDDIKDMIKSGELNDGNTISALTLAGLHLGHLK